jgi:hypothetical protein
VGEWRYSPKILDVGTGWRCPCRFTPEDTAQGTHCMGGWDQYGHYGQQKNLYPLTGIEPGLLGRPDSSLVAILTVRKEKLQNATINFAMVCLSAC